MRICVPFLLAIVGICWGCGRVSAADRRSVHLRCESAGDSLSVAAGIQSVQWSSASPGDLIVTARLQNEGSWEFDGRSTIAYSLPSDAEGYSENFTWEGFFLFPRSNTFHSETGIADRLLTQFAFDKGDWTRLAIGLAAGADRSPRLCVELEGFEGRTFGMGDRVVTPLRWHHFALVHEGTAAAAKIRWFLDYEPAGEIFLGGQSNQNTLRPPGTASMAIGARLKSGSHVNRGFEGLIDEVRFVPRPLRVREFLRSDGATVQRPLDTTRLEARDQEFWEVRHQWARRQAKRWTRHAPARKSIDDFFDQPSDTIEDAAFLRRLSLVVRGRTASLDEVVSFLNDRRVDKRTRVIDAFLASPEWADSWVGYWQDVLAENPSVVFPTLNNSGAFRHWIHESFCDNKPLDRFVTELLLLEHAGSEETGDAGPAGFGLAFGNDAPMAMRAHVAMTAFAAVDLKCARCHDSPFDKFQQSDLFQLAAYLSDAPLEVPLASVTAVGKSTETGLISTSLSAGQIIQPKRLTSHWLDEPDEPSSLKPIQSGPRAELAALLTSPRNRRFSDVIANRLWQRLFGKGLIEPVDRWNDNPQASSPELLLLLSAELVESGYDLKVLSRKILRSAAWQRPRDRRRRMSAEQLVDSLFLAVGKDFQAETLGVHATDPGATQLPKPHRAWQFAALPNERDRPALGMPVNQTIVDLMKTFGWDGNRLQPRSERERSMSPLQPLMLLGGLMSQRITTLSDQSAITELCLQDVEVTSLVDRLFVTILGRYPTKNQRQHFADYLSPDFEQRRTGDPARPFVPLSTFQPDWRKHLEADQTRLMMDAQQRVARGERPTARLTTDFRKRAEDVLWALVNSPEFVVIP